MYCLTTENSFDAAHFLHGYSGKCSNLHGHRWRVVVTVEGEVLKESGQEKGMLVDFKELKKDVKKVTDAFDHSFIYEEGSLKEKTIDALHEEGFLLIPFKTRPTAENFAKYFYDEIEKCGYTVQSVCVYETPNNCATYARSKEN